MSEPDEDRVAQLRALLHNGSLPAVAPINPDEYAKAVRLATARGLSTAEAATLLRGATAGQARQFDPGSFGQSNPISARSPTLQAWMAQADNAAVAQDDAVKLSEMDDALQRLRPDRSLVGDWNAALGEGFDGLTASYYHLAVATGRLTPEEAARGAAEANRRIRQSQLGASKAQQAYEKELADASWWGVVPTALSNPARFAGMLLQNLAFGAPSLALGGLGAAIGAPAGPVGAGVGMVAGAFTGGMAVEFGAWVDQQLNAAGFDTADPEQLFRAYSDPELMGRINWEATRKGIGTAGIDALSTLIGMRGAGAAVRAGETVIKRGAVHLAKELAAHSALELVGEATGQIAAVGPGKVNWKDVTLEGVASLGQSGGEMALARGARFLAGRKLAGAQAVQDAKAVTDTAKAWTGSKLVGRLPTKARDFVQAQLVGQDAELFAARFDKEAWDEHWQAQGKDPAEEAERVLPATGRAAYAASDGSGTLTVPLGNYLEAYADSPDLEPLTEMARWRPDGPNLREQDIAGGEQLSALEDEVARTTTLYQQERAVSEQIAAIDEQLKALPVEVPRGANATYEGSAEVDASATAVPAKTSEPDPVEVAESEADKLFQTDPEAAVAHLKEAMSKIAEGKVAAGEPEAAAAPGKATRASLLAERAKLSVQLSAMALQRQEKELAGAEIQSRVEADLIKAGRPKAEAKHGATIYASAVAAFAQRNGMSIDEVEKMLTVTIREAQAAPGSPRLMQGTRGIFFQGGQPQLPAPGSHNAPTFFSFAQRTVEAMPKSKLSPEQWIKTLKNKGVKDEELHWLDLQGWLDKLGRNATREEVLEYIAANQITVSDVVLGEPSPVDPARVEEMTRERMQRSTSSDVRRAVRNKVDELIDDGTLQEQADTAREELLDEGQDEIDTRAQELIDAEEEVSSDEIDEYLREDANNLASDGDFDDDVAQAKADALEANYSEVDAFKEDQIDEAEAAGELATVAIEGEQAPFDVVVTYPNGYVEHADSYKDKQEAEREAERRRETFRGEYADEHAGELQTEAEKRWVDENFDENQALEDAKDAYVENADRGDVASQIKEGRQVSERRREELQDQARREFEENLTQSDITERVIEGLDDGTIITPEDAGGFDIDAFREQFTAATPDEREAAIRAEVTRELEDYVSPTKFKGYTVGQGGGEGNYRELLLTLDKRGAMMEKALAEGDFRNRSHFDPPNFVVHARFDDRTDTAGNKVLFIEEIQSDWHHEGRERGYRGEALSVEAVDALESRREAANAAVDVAEAALSSGLAHQYDTPTRERVLSEVSDGVSDVNIADMLREKGLQPPTTAQFELMNQVRAAQSDLRAVVRELNANDERRHAVPDAPFKTTWRDLMLKRLIRWAAERGYDKVAWVTGKQSADRYNVAKYVDELAYYESGERLMGWKDGQQVVSSPVEKDELPDYVGKELAKRLLSDESATPAPESTGGGLSGEHRLKGENLQVGGQFHRTLYDEWIPSSAKALIKKWGGKVETAKIDFGDEKVPHWRPFIDGIGGWHVDLMNLDSSARLHRPELTFASRNEAVMWADTQAAKDLLAQYGPNPSGGTPVQSFAITEEMRKEALNVGQRLMQEQQGFTEIGEPNDHGQRFMRVGFLEKANASTFIHELGHVFLTMLGDMAGRESAPQQTKDDLAAIREFLGAAPGTRFTEAQHEQWARSWEAFHREGKAPSARLRAAFAAFRNFMRRIYVSLLDLERQAPGTIKLSDDIRAVMGRMLATDEEIAAAQYELGGPALPAAALVGLTDAEKADYLKSVQAAQDETTARADRTANRALADLTAAMRGEEMDKLRAAARAEALASPAMTLVDEMLNGKVEKFDRQAVVEIFGADDPRTKGLAEMGLLTDKDGIHPDLVVQARGATSVDALVDGVLATRDLDAIVERVARARLKEQRPELLGAGAVRKDAAKLLATEERADQLEREERLLRRLFRRAAAAATKKGAEAKEAKGAAASDATERRQQFDSVPSPADMRWRAERMLAPMELRHIRPSEFLSASRRESTASADRARVGDWEGAAKAKSRERLNFELYRQSLAIKAKAERNSKRLRYMGTERAKTVLGKAGDSYTDQQEALLDRFSFARISAKAVERRKSLADWLDRIEAEGKNAPDVPAWLKQEARRQHWTTLTASQLQDVRDTAEQIYHLASVKNKLLAGKRAGEIETARAEVRDEVKASAGVKKLRRGERQPLWRRMYASHRVIDSLARQMGGAAGKIWNYGVRPLQEAASEETAQAVAANTALRTAFDTHLSAEDRKNWTRPRAIDGVREQLSLMQRVMVAINWGNREGRDRLLHSFTQAEIEAILESLEQRHADFAAAIWDLENSYWPTSREIWRKIKGVTPPKVEAVPFKARDGAVAWQGGYHRLMYENHQRIEEMDLLEMDARISRGDAIRATTKSGSMIARSEAVADRLQLRLDFGVVTSHIAEIIHFNTHALALRDVKAVMLSDSVQDELKARHGEAIAQQFGSSYRHVAAGNWAANDASARGLGYLRAGTIIMRIGLKVTTNLINLGGLTQSMVAIGTTPVLRAMGYLLREPTKGLQIREQIMAVSKTMAHRDTTLQREIYEQLARLENGSKVAAARTAINHMAFSMLTVTQAMVDLPTWIAAYEQAGGDYAALRSGDPAVVEDFADAIAAADNAVIGSQGGGRHVDLPEVMRGGEYQKLFTTFYGFAARTLNLAAETNAKLKKDPKSLAAYARWGSEMALLFVVPALWASIINHGFRGDDDDEEGILETAARQMFSSILGLFVFIREISALPLGIDDYSGSAGSGVFSEVYNLGVQLGQLEADGPTLKASLKVVGIAAHLPTSAAIESYQGLAGWMDGTAPLTAVLMGPPRER